MAEQATTRRPEPVVRTIVVADIVDALGQGLRDFRAAPFYGLFFGGTYAFGGMLIVLTAFAFDLSYLSYPLAAGFALIGPFAAVGLYEVSRRLEAGTSLSWGGVLGVIMAQRKREMGWMAFVTMFVLIMWMYQVRILVAIFLGLRAPSTLQGLTEAIFTTPEGLLFLLVGHIIGAILALILFSLTVVSFPLLLERDIDFITAMITSVRSVTTNPMPMIGWAAVVTLVLFTSIAAFFIGLFVTLPILGHTTWHLYRRLVEPVGAE